MKTAWELVFNFTLHDKNETSLFLNLHKKIITEKSLVFTLQKIQQQEAASFSLRLGIHLTQ